MKNLTEFLFQITWTENDTEFPLEVNNQTGELSAKFDMTNTVNTSFLFNLTAKDKVIFVKIHLLMMEKRFEFRRNLTRK